MPGTFQGSSHPEHNSTPIAVADITVALSKSAAASDKRLDRGAVFDQWVAAAGQVPATVPMWLSRPKWIATVCRWATTEEGRTALSRHHVSLPMFIAVIRAIAHHAEGKTGRNVAVTNETIAEGAAAIHGKCSVRTVKKIRQLILAPAGWAMEVKRGAGQGGGRYNRPSIWHLLSRAVCTLSCSLNLEMKSTVTTNSPSAARTRRRSSSHTTPAAPTTVDSQENPRNPHTLNLANHLAGRCHGFGRIHPGRLADVLEASHLEVSAWSPRQLLGALSAQAAKSHFAWPDHVANPAGFLAHRLRELPVRPQILAPTPIPPRFVREAPTSRATPSVIAAAKEALLQSVRNARKAAAA